MCYIYLMKPEIIALDSELSCAASLLNRTPPKIPAAQVHIDEARMILMKLADNLKIEESADIFRFIEHWRGFSWTVKPVS
jgi:hypothetical protein